MIKEKQYGFADLEEKDEVREWEDNEWMIIVLFILACVLLLITGGILWRARQVKAYNWSR